MKKFVVPLAALVLLAANAPAAIPSQGIEVDRSVSLHERPSKENCNLVEFSGEVKRDERYVRALPDNLEFRLLPSREGWSVSIGRPGDKTENYVGIATPPYHGVNEAVIEAWHFRNTDNTGPNDGGVNAPTNVRDFSFVLTHAEYMKFFDALNVWSGGDPRATEKQRDAASNFLIGGPRRDGMISITDMKLGGLERGTRPWFDSMKFHVELCFPRPATTPPAKASPSKSAPPKKNP